MESNVIYGDSACEVVQPIINNIEPSILSHLVTADITILGFYFMPGSTVVIPGVVVNSVTFVSPGELLVNVTTSDVDAFHNVTLTNDCGSFVVASGLEVKLSSWKDLRFGGDPFTLGTNIRIRSGMTVLRDAFGMHFSGLNPWSSWVKFTGCAWTRGQNKTIQWVFTRPDAAMMIGIGSDATNEGAGDQYRQGEIHAYFQSSTTMWGLYGNNGTVGGTGNQGVSAALGSFAAWKVKFEGDGGQGSLFTLYGLNGVNVSDWDDETNVINSFTVGGSLNPDEPNLMPFIIPRTGGTQRFLALKVE